MKAFMAYLTTISRHFIALAVGAVTGWLASIGVEVDPNITTELELAIMGLVTGGIYIAVEKGLKNVWVKKFRESQPGETATNEGFGE